MLTINGVSEVQICVHILCIIHCKNMLKKKSHEVIPRVEEPDRLAIFRVPGLNRLKRLETQTNKQTNGIDYTLPLLDYH